MFRFVAALLLLAGCTREPPKDAEHAMRKMSGAPDLVDDLALPPFLDAVAAELAFMDLRTEPAHLTFGSRVYTKAEYLAGLRRFLELAKSDPAHLGEAVARDFDFYEVYGNRRWGDVFMTSYFEPVIEGARARSDRFRQAIYGVPPDLLALNLAPFDPKFADERKLRARLKDKALLPYYTREEIDSKGALEGKGLELCYVDPIDAFSLQIQGSGVVRLEDGTELRLGYGEKNGQKYESIGGFLHDQIPSEKMNMGAIEAYLRGLPPDQLQALLNRNPSYVFFKVMTQNALTYLGVPATAGRTIATDPKFFPKGALAFLSSPKPMAPFDLLAMFRRAGAPDPGGAEIHRFVLDQDIGGAIKGGGRLDLFWGRGRDAGDAAGMIRQRGRLIYIAPK